LSTHHTSRVALEGRTLRELIRLLEANYVVRETSRSRERVARAERAVVKIRAEIARREAR
jgi:hypothetical protein